MSRPYSVNARGSLSRLFDIRSANSPQAKDGLVLFSRDDFSYVEIVGEHDVWFIVKRRGQVILAQGQSWEDASTMRYLLAFE